MFELPLFLLTIKSVAGPFTVQNGVIQAGSPNTLLLQNTVADGATAIGTNINSVNNLANATAKLLSIQNAGVEKLNLNANGNLITLGGLGIGGNSPGGLGLQASGSTLQINSGGLIQLRNSNNGTNFFQGGVAGVTSITSDVADGAAAVSVSIDSVNAFANATAKILSVRTGGVEKRAIDLNGKDIIPTAGGAAIVGTLTLNGATAVVVSTTAVTANSKIFLSRHTLGGTMAHFSVTNITAGTSFAVTGVAGDTSTVDWMLVN